MAKMKISFDLFDTVDQNEHIQEVYFTKDNQHFFNFHELKGKKYGSLKTEKVFSHSVGDRKFFKMVQVENKNTLIVETMTREEVLAEIPVDEKEIFPTGKSRARLVAMKAAEKKTVKKDSQTA